ncbi:MAG TPA: hypothetical protein VIP55_02480 [Agromyces sp.]
MSLSRPTRRTRPLAGAALAAAGALALLLSGCAGDAPAPSPSPSADAAEPIFASDEEALAAAVEAYEAFVAVSDQLSANPDGDPSIIESVVTSRYAPEFIGSLAEFHESGLSTTGEITRNGFELAQASETSDQLADVQIYVCVDYTGSDIVNSAGEVVTPEDRPATHRSIVRLLGDEARSTQLLVDSTELWDSSEGC